MTNIRTAIIDDHAFVRLGLRSLLETHELEDRRFEIVAEEASGASGCDAVERLLPDLVLLDLNLPDMDGYAVLHRVQRLALPPKILILSTHAGPMPVRRALRLGASGFVSKSQAPDVLLRAIQSVLRGYCFVPPEMTPALEPGHRPGWPPRGLLTPRERSVAESLILGRKNKAIAHLLCLSAKTVSAHKRNIYRKLAVTSLIELADCLRETDSYGVRPGDADRSRLADMTTGSVAS